MPLRSLKVLGFERGVACGLDLLDLAQQPYRLGRRRRHRRRCRRRRRVGAAADAAAAAPDALKTSHLGDELALFGKRGRV